MSLKFKTVRNSKARYPIFIFLINYLPLLFLVTGIMLPIILKLTIALTVIYLLVYIYLLPPILAQIIMLFLGKPMGNYTINSKGFLVWWLLTQLQLPFNRFPFFEELLRMAPGFYSSWLNLWGAKVSLLAYWSPGVEIVDRTHMEIHTNVLLGFNCKLTGHLISEIDNELTLILAPVVIEKKAIIGTFAKISPGCHVHENEILPATFLMAPFNYFKDGKRYSQK